MFRATAAAKRPGPGATVTLRGDGWEVSQPVAAYATYSLDWHAFVVPAEASGEAALTVQAGNGEPITLATYTIEQSDHLFAPPAFDVPVQTDVYRSGRAGRVQRGTDDDSRPTRSSI